MRWWWCPIRLSWIFILLTHGSNSQRVHISLHLDTVSWFRPNRSLFFRFIAVYFLMLCTFYCCVLLLFIAVYFLLLCTFYCCVLFRRSSKYQYYGVWFDLTGREPHSRLECFPLHHFFDWGFVVLNVIYNNCVIHIHVVMHFCYIMRCFEWKRICTGFFPSFIYICINVWDPVIKKIGLGSHQPV